ncbi:N-acetyltransferase [Cellulosimicrobium marinum]|uniref:N-acetyltransferase n=1 Tax=Cellulosimicrobium marinum TaxID=1638992 RepID=UPI001E367376|nr:N-acetyltransferase [Cellulosimicrobium marinum]MCB7136130.1 N-acetyltransferase [Cellulosimicrobium marinum]
MTTTAPSWRVLRAPEPPADLDDPDAWAVLAYSEIEHDRELAVWGWTDQWAPPWVLLGALRHQVHHRKVLFAAVRADEPAAGPAGEPAVPERGFDPGDVAGVVLAVVPRDTAEGIAWVSPRVREGEHADEVRDLVLDAAERFVAGLGRDTVAFTTPHSPEPDAGPTTIEPPTGVGRVPGDAPPVRAALARGYALEQVTRHSTLHLPVPAVVLDALEAEARRSAGAYRTSTWFDEVPEGHLDGMAELWGRMSTDAPSAGLDQQEEHWDAGRVRDHLSDLADRSQHVLITVAEDVGTGALVAFSVLQVPRAEVPFGFQEDTLVVREHRGHRLGTLVKVANLRALAAWRPGVVRIHTWNAEENAHMLAINVALGFRADGVAAVWQKRLTTAG